MLTINTTENNQTRTIKLEQVDITEITTLLNRYKLTLNIVGKDEEIPGSFWGDEEAGLINNQVYARPDTPIHSLLHESCHYICMDKARRKNLHTDAGGTTDEENAVCYLQIILSQRLSFMGQTRMMRDMDSWGYNFRLGSCKAWFEEDTDDEYQWLIKHRLIKRDKSPTFRLRK